MSNSNNHGSSEGTPQEYPQTNPRNLYPTTDIRFVVLELGKLEERVDNIIKASEKIADKLDKQSDRMQELVISVDRIKTTVWAVGGCLTLLLPAFGLVLWWALGERINVALKPQPSVQQQSPPQPTTPPRR